MASVDEGKDRSSTYKSDLNFESFVLETTSQVNFLYYCIALVIFNKVFSAFDLLNPELFQSWF